MDELTMKVTSPHPAPTTTAHRMRRGRTRRKVSKTTRASRKVSTGARATVARPRT